MKFTSIMIFAALVLSLMLSSAGIASAHPGIVVTVLPDSLNAQLGQTVVYEVTTESITDTPEHVILSIKNPLASWGYVFDNPEFDIAPGQNITTNLSVTVPASASQGTYQSNVLGTGAVPGYEVFPTETSFFTFITVAIPEFPSIIVPVVATIGIVLVLRRGQKEK